MRFALSKEQQQSLKNFRVRAFGVFLPLLRLAPVGLIARQPVSEKFGGPPRGSANVYAYCASTKKGILRYALTLPLGGLPKRACPTPLS